MRGKSVDIDSRLRFYVGTGLYVGTADLIRCDGKVVKLDYGDGYTTRFKFISENH